MSHQYVTLKCPINMSHSNVLSKSPKKVQLFFFLTFQLLYFYNILLFCILMTTLGQFGRFFFMYWDILWTFGDVQRMFQDILGRFVRFKTCWNILGCFGDVCRGFLTFWDVLYRFGTFMDVIGRFVPFCYVLRRFGMFWDVWNVLGLFYFSMFLLFYFSTLLLYYFINAQHTRCNRGCSTNSLMIQSFIH